MTVLYLITLILLIISFLADRKKTFKALEIAVRRVLKILPAFLKMLLLVSILLYFIPDEVIMSFLGGTSKLAGVLLGMVFGSITLMPGFIAFPLSGILLKKGVSYMVITAFTTTLMMVGVLTYPVEKEYFGRRVTIIRNSISLLIAVIITVVVGLLYGELM